MEKPCCISWCIALTDELFCKSHEADQSLHPTPYKRERPPARTFPKRPWDDEKPWYEDVR